MSALLLIGFWAAVLGFIAWMPKDKMDMVWLVSLAVLLFGGLLLTWLFPGLR